MNEADGEAETGKTGGDVEEDGERKEDEVKRNFGRCQPGGFVPQWEKTHNHGTTGNLGEGGTMPRTDARNLPPVLRPEAIVRSVNIMMDAFATRGIRVRLPVDTVDGRLPRGTKVLEEMFDVDLLCA